MDYKRIASELLNELGGTENINASTHCATRLRLVLNDDSVINEKKIEDVEAVKGTFFTSGQFQIILGSGIVDEVYKEFVKLTGTQEKSKQEVKDIASQKMNPIQRLVKTVSDIFIPIIPAIVACGLLMGVNNVLTAEDLFISGQSLITAYPQVAGLAAMINTFSNAAYVFLPVLIGFSATQKFGGNAFLGAVLGMLMVHPDLLSAYAYPAALIENTVPYWDIFGFEIPQVGYQGTVLPILVSAFILAKLERVFHRFVPTSLDNLLTPLFSLFITALLTFTLVGPFTRELGNLLTDGLIWLYDVTGFIGGALIGLIYAPIVITGMHHSFIAVETQLLANIAETGGTFLFPIASMSNVAQGAAALSVFLITKNQKTKSLASASSLSAYLGITEPAMFGVNLKLRYPFYAAMIGSSVGSAYVTLFQVKAVATGATGLPGIIAIRTGDTLQFIIGIAITTMVTIGTTYILSTRSKETVNTQENTGEIVGGNV